MKKNNIKKFTVIGSYLTMFAACVVFGCGDKNDKKGGGESKDPLKDLPELDANKSSDVTETTLYEWEVTEAKEENTTDSFINEIKSGQLVTLGVGNKITFQFQLKKRVKYTWSKEGKIKGDDGKYKKVAKDGKAKDDLVADEKTNLANGHTVDIEVLDGAGADKKDKITTATVSGKDLGIVKIDLKGKTGGTSVSSGGKLLLSVIDGSGKEITGSKETLISNLKFDYQ